MEEVMMEKLDELLSVRASCLGHPVSDARVRASCLKPELPCMLLPELSVSL
jgi:hypothetical protein